MLVLRSLLVWTVMLLATSVVALVVLLGVVLSLGQLRDPMLTAALPLWARLFRAVSGVHLQVTGAEHLAGRRPRVLVVNHGSILDLPAVSILGPPAPCPVAKASLRWTPPLNLVFWLMGAVFVDRARSPRDVRRMQAAADRIRRQRRTVLIAPEGTRSRDGRLGRFKKGAFHLARQAQAEIVPVVIRGAWELAPPTGWLIRRGTVRVEVMPPRPPPEDPAAAAAELEAEYRRWLGQAPAEDAGHT